MIDTLAHRGPDDEAVYSAPGGSPSLGHRRLSIVDPHGGAQPIFSNDSKRAVVANGEIYNFPALQPELAQCHGFSTSSDNEAILHLFEEHGPNLGRHLEGMYAFAIADEDRLIVARDPIGIKPLYLGRLGDATVFASELKAFDPRADQVREFPPGHVWDSASGLSSFHSLASATAPKHAEGRTIADYVAMVRETIERVVIKHLMSDVPVGAFLSGGLDSSIIAALARSQLDELHTFAVGVEGSNDLEAARVVAGHLDTIHHEYVMTPDEVAACLPEIIYYLESFDQDLVRSAIPCYFTSRLAAEHVKVVLTGEGADEIFAGYDYYKGIPSEATLQEELYRSVGSLHNINLQRVDRMTMAHSIEGRVPFLDLEAVELGRKVPAELKLSKDYPQGKWILRQAFEDLLPHAIVWRDKEQFDEGSGTVDLLAGVSGLSSGAGELRDYRQRHKGAGLRSSEEGFYHRLLVDAYDNPEPVLANMGRWSERPAFS